MAPEIVQRMEYEGKAVDMWSLGILLYALLCGCFPFRAKSYPDLYRRVARGTFAIPEELSPSVRDLIRQLLTVDPIQRITAHAAMRHSWLQSQSACAPDINKMRSDTAILISDRAQDDLDDQVISEITTFGLPKEDLVQLVLSKTHSSIATLYYLLLDTTLTKRKLMGGNRRAFSSSNPQSSSSANRKVYGGSSSGVTGAGIVNPAMLTANAGHPYFMQQQQQQQVQMQAAQQTRQEYVGGYGGATGVSMNRPKSASNGRGVITGQQRPLSAYAGRR
jgi:serine/threonine protein kinase